MKSSRVILVSSFLCLAAAVVVSWPMTRCAHSNLVLAHQDFSTDFMGALWKTRYYKNLGFSALLNNPRIIWHTPDLFYPFGMNLYVLEPHYFLEAFVPLVCLGFVPFPLDYNLYLLLAMVGNGLAISLAVWLLVKDSKAAAVSGVLIVTAPYMVTDLLSGRSVQGIVWFIPLFLVFFWKWMSGGRRSNLVLSALLLAVSAFLYWFYGLFMCLVVAIFCLVRGLFQPGKRLDTLKRGVILTCLFLCIILPAAYPFIQEATLRGDVQGLSVKRSIPLTLAPDLGTVSGESALVPVPGMLRESLFNPAGIFSILLALCILLPGENRPAGTEKKGKDIKKRGLVFLGYACFFLALVPGPYMSIPGTSIRLPSLFTVLYAVIPGFSRVSTTARFIPVGLVFLCLAAGCAFKRLCAMLRNEKRRWILTGVTVVIIMMLGRFSIKLNVKPLPVTPGPILQLASASPGGVIDLPLLSERAGAEALWFQTVHKMPILTDNNVLWEFARPVEFNKLLATNLFLRSLERLAGSDLIDPHSVSLRGIEFFKKHQFRYIVVHKNALAGDEEENRRKLAGRGRRRRSRLTDNLKALLGEPLASDPVTEVFDLTSLYNRFDR